MSRLTTHQSVMGRNRKHDIAYGMGSIWLKKIGKYKYELIEEVIDKLGELENLEEELGINLITLFKLIKSKKIYSFSNNGIAKNDINGINIHTNTIRIWNGVCKVEYPLSEYGKSFALTKEELKNE